MPTVETLKTRLTSRQSTMAILGLGYVGLLLRFSSVGFKVLGIDVDPGKIEKINAGQSYIEHIASDRIASARQAGCEATTDFARVAEADALIICVPTPLNKNREPGLSYVTNTVDSLAPHLRPGQVMAPFPLASRQGKKDTPSVFKVRLYVE